MVPTTGTKYVTLENLSTNVTIASNPLVVKGRWVIKSIVTYSNGRVGVGRGCNNPIGAYVDTLCY